MPDLDEVEVEEFLKGCLRFRGVLERAVRARPDSFPKR